VTWVAIAAFSTAVVGDNLNYLIGKMPGSRLVKRYGHHLKIREGVDATRRYFSKYGGRTVLFGRLIAGIDAFIPFTAGLSDMPYGRFVMYDTAGIVLYTALFVSLGYFFGDRWEYIDSIFNRLGYGLLGLIVIIVAAVLIVRHRRKKREEASPKPEEPPPPIDWDGED
jgi:membrane-associated protein